MTVLLFLSSIQCLANVRHRRRVVKKDFQFGHRIEMHIFYHSSPIAALSTRKDSAIYSFLDRTHIYVTNTVNESDMDNSKEVLRAMKFFYFHLQIFVSQSEGIQTPTCTLLHLEYINADRRELSEPRAGHSQ